MRKSVIEAEFTDSTVETPFLVKQKAIQRTSICFVSVWLTTNVVTFMLGFFVKGVWSTDGVDDGSM